MRNVRRTLTTQTWLHLNMSRPGAGLRFIGTWPRPCDSGCCFLMNASERCGVSAWLKKRFACTPAATVPHNSQRALPVRAGASVARRNSLAVVVFRRSRRRCRCSLVMSMSRRLPNERPASSVRSPARKGSRESTNTNKPKNQQTRLQTQTQMRESPRPIHEP